MEDFFGKLSDALQQLKNDFATSELNEDRNGRIEFICESAIQSFVNCFHFFGITNEILQRLLKK